MPQQKIIIGLCIAALATIIGAFGAHALKAVLTLEQLASFEVGVRYQHYFSHLLILIGIANHFYKHKFINIGFNLIMLGIVLFSGSIFLLNLLKSTGELGLRGLGILTPIGGVCFIAGIMWVILGIKNANNAKA
jgi:uncharacterized membrane protein YgdD (TMEM256/DUF423 family)